MTERNSIRLSFGDVLTEYVFLALDILQLFYLVLL